MIETYFSVLQGNNFIQKDVHKEKYQYLIALVSSAKIYMVTFRCSENITSY